MQSWPPMPPADSGLRASRCPVRPRSPRPSRRKTGLVDDVTRAIESAARKLVYAELADLDEARKAAVEAP